MDIDVEEVPGDSLLRRSEAMETVLGLNGASGYRRSPHPRPEESQYGTGGRKRDPLRGEGGRRGPAGGPAR